MWQYYPDICSPWGPRSPARPLSLQRFPGTSQLVMTKVLWFLVEGGGGGQRNKEKNLDWIHCDLSSQRLLCFHSLYPDENAQTQPVSGDRAIGNDSDTQGCGLSHQLCSAFMLSRVRLFATSWTVACQALVSMEFSVEEYWSGLSFPYPGDLPNPGIEPASLMSPAFSGGYLTTEPPGASTANLIASPKPL